MQNAANLHWYHFYKLNYAMWPLGAAYLFANVLSFLAYNFPGKNEMGN